MRRVSGTIRPFCSAIGMPAGERLEADHLVVEQFHLRLERRDDVVFVQRGREFVGSRQGRMLTAREPPMRQRIGQQCAQCRRPHRLGKRAGDAQSKRHREPRAGCPHPVVQAGHQDDNWIAQVRRNQPKQTDTLPAAKRQVQHDNVVGMLADPAAGFLQRRGAVGGEPKRCHRARDDEALNRLIIDHQETTGGIQLRVQVNSGRVLVGPRVSPCRMKKP
jgi:hypothetical protein